MKHSEYQNQIDESSLSSPSNKNKKHKKKKNKELTGASESFLMMDCTENSINNIDKKKLKKKKHDKKDNTNTTEEVNGLQSSNLEILIEDEGSSQKISKKKKKKSRDNTTENIINSSDDPVHEKTNGTNNSYSEEKYMENSDEMPSTKKKSKKGNHNNKDDSNDITAKSSNHSNSTKKKNKKRKLSNKDDLDDIITESDTHSNSDKSLDEPKKKKVKCSEDVKSDTKVKSKKKVSDSAKLNTNNDEPMEKKVQSNVEVTTEEEAPVPDSSNDVTEDQQNSTEEGEHHQITINPEIGDLEFTATDSSLNYDALASRSFDSLRGFVSAPTMAAIDSYGFKTMTEIQARAIPPLMEGKDLRGTAKTGSGKTLAFLIPSIELMHKLQFEPCHGTGVIILCPTRELSMQSYGVARIFAERHNFSHGLIIGGANRKAEIENLKKGINILVATPGRMLDHLKNTRGFQFGNLVCFILDEADRMLSIGFEEEMKAILKVIPKRRQTMLFSATRTKKTDELSTLALKVSLVEIDVDADKSMATVDQLTQSYLLCPTEKRFLVLYTFLKRKKNKKIMVFFSSCDSVRFYHDLLTYIDLPVLCIHGKQKQAKRTEAFFSFNAAKSATLLCTDVAARGWDIPEVDWIVQYDPPEDPSEYIHRVGRTARGGREGQALLILREEELPFVRYLRERKVKLNQIEVSQDKVLNIQRQLEKLMNKNYYLANCGKMAFKSYIHTYMRHRNKDIFNVHVLDMHKVGKSFGFDNPPVIDLTINYDKKRSLEYKKQRNRWNY